MAFKIYVHENKLTVYSYLTYNMTCGLTSELLTKPIESFRTIAELSKNAQKSSRTHYKMVLYSCSAVPSCGFKNRLIIFKRQNS